MKTKLGIIATATILVAVTVIAILFNQGLQSTMKTMQFIEGRMRPGGTFVDYDNSIAVASAEDLGWWEKDGAWYVMYGKLQLEFTKSQLKNPNYLTQIAKIGLDIRGDLEEGALRFFWFETELEEWVPR